MVRTRQSMLPGAKKTSQKIKEKKEAAINKATNAFNDYWSDLSESQVNKFSEIGYDKNRLLKGYLSDSGALGFKAMMMNKDNFNTIQAKLIINGIKKWASSLFKKNKDNDERESPSVSDAEQSFVLKSMGG